MSQYSLSTTSPFLKGLNTELNKLVDSTEYTSDELNCMIRANNTRSRRPGIDYEELYKFNNEYLDLSLPDLAFQCIEWTDINSPDEAETYTGYPYIVCQVGGTIIFFRNQGQPFSQYQESFTLDLSTYAIDPTSDEYMRKRCRFAAAYGCIFIASEAIYPLYLRSAQEPEDPELPVTSYPEAILPLNLWNSKKGRWAGTGTFTFYVDGIQVGKTSIQEFYNGANGNCSNGPWMLTSTQLAVYWNQIMPEANRHGLTAVPKYTDATPTRWGLYSPTQGRQEGGNGAWIYDNIRFVSNSPDMRGSTIKIVMSGLAQWRSSSNQETITHSCTLAGGSSYQYRSNLDLIIRDTNVGAQDYLAVADNPTKMSYAHLYNLLNQGWTPKLIADYYNAQGTHVFPGNNLAQQFLKDEKTSAFKPQNAINMTFGNSPAARGHYILPFFNQRRVLASSLVASFNQLVSSIGGTTFEDIVDTNWDLTDPTQANETDALSQVPNTKPRKPYVVDLCAYAGRIFYLSGDVLLYSQVIAEDISKADKCYTEADPTGEEISDVIETDGGLISLPDIGEGLKLQVVGDSLLIFGTRGNMMLSGTANNIFTATAYSAGAVSTVPTQAPDSFVSTEYGVFYWGVTGITVLGVAAEGGIQSKDLTTDKILTWFGKLTNTQHKYCKGVYSASKKKIYWFYPSDDALPRRLDMCLVYDIQRDAFCPQKIVSSYTEDDTSIAVPEVVSGVQLKVPFKAYKEYPIYAVFDEITEDPVYLYSRVYSGTGESTQNITPTVEDETSDTVDISTTTPYTTTFTVNLYDCDLVGKYQLSYDQNFVDWCASTTNPDTDIGFLRRSSSSFAAYDWRGCAFLKDVTLSNATLYTADPVSGTTNTLQINNGDSFWIRFKCDDVSVQGGFGRRTIAVLVDNSNTYTADTLPDITSSAWTVLQTDNDAREMTGEYAIQHRKLLYSIGGGYSYFKWYWKTFKDLVSDNASYIVSSEQYYYTRPVTAASTLYSDSSLTTPAGVVSDLINNGKTYRICHEYNITRNKEGSNGRVTEYQTVNTSVGGVTYVRYSPTDVFEALIPGADVSTTECFEDIDLTVVPTYGGTNLVSGLIPVTVDELNNRFVNNYNVTYNNNPSGDIEIYDNDGYRVLADTPLDTEEFSYESSILLCLDPANSKVTFGDFRNNYMRDWAEGDRTGAGFEFSSYMISHPVNSQDFVRAKTMPYLFSYFKRTETGALTTGQYLYPSHCQGSVRWDWRTDGVNGKWDSPNELYRFRPRTLLSQGYVTNKTNIRGIGRAFQIKLEGIRDDNFIVEALGFNLCKDERI